MYSFTNLPTKNESPRIEGVVEEHSYRIQTSDGWRICDVGRVTDEQTAGDIADAIHFARDVGYQHALADVRKQLGINQP